MPRTQVQSFGDLLREFRVAAGLTQEALAEAAHMSIAAISKLERGTRQRPYRATIALLADALDLSPDNRGELERAAQRGGGRFPSLTAQDIKAAINLPIHFSSFVGRERDLAKVRDMVATQRLVTLVGAGGVGKTRLAVRAAEDLIAENSTADRFDSVWFGDLSAAIDGPTAMTAIASAVGMEQCRSLETLIGYLRSQRFLLILDNCEHLVEEIARLLSELLRHAPNAQVLATSRAALGVDGERIYRVPPLTVPSLDNEGRLSVSQALEFGAVRLFVDRAEAADSRFELTEAMVPTVIEICRRVDGIALAIELAAARTNAFTVATIAQRLDEHFFVFTDRPSSLSHPKTMRTVFDWSYGLLTQTESSVFRKLAIFAGGFTLELAASILAGEADELTTIETLASLVDKSLLQCDLYAEPPRYKMLEPARQYARHKLRAQEELNATARSHANALLALAEDFDSRLELTPDEVWDAYIEREADNFRAAFEWALGPQGDSNLALRLAGSRSADWCGFKSGEMRVWVNSALELCDEATPRKTLARLVTMAARAALAFERDPEVSLSVCRRALSLQKDDDLRGVADAQYLVALALQNMGRLDEAETVLREIIATTRSCGAQNEYSIATKALGNVRYGFGDLDEARALTVEALKMDRAGGCERYAANATVTLAEIEFASGNVDKAIELAEEAARFFRAHADLLRLSVTLCNVSAYYIGALRFDEARNRAREALKSSRTIGKVRDFAWSMQHLVATEVLSSDRNEPDMKLRLAAGVLGFVDESARLRAIPRYHTEQQEYEQILGALRKSFDENELKQLMADGSRWTDDRAVEEALAI